MHKVYCDRCGKEIDIRNNHRNNREAREPYYYITAFRPVTREYVGRDGENKTHTYMRSYYPRSYMRSYYPQYCKECSDALTKVLDMWAPLKYLEDNDLLDTEACYDGPQCEYNEEE